MVFEDEKVKVGYIGEIEISCESFSVFSEKPGEITLDAQTFSDNSPADCMGDKPTVRLISMRRIRYIEEE